MTERRTLRQISGAALVGEPPPAIDAADELAARERAHKVLKEAAATLRQIERRGACRTEPKT